MFYLDCLLCFNTTDPECVLLPFKYTKAVFSFAQFVTYGALADLPVGTTNKPLWVTLCFIFCCLTNICFLHTAWKWMQLDPSELLDNILQRRK